MAFLSSKRRKKSNSFNTSWGEGGGGLYLGRGACIRGVRASNRVYFVVHR